MPFQPLGEALCPRMELVVGENAPAAVHATPNKGFAVAVACLDVALKALVGKIEPAIVLETELILLKLAPREYSSLSCAHGTARAIPLHPILPLWCSHGPQHRRPLGTKRTPPGKGPGLGPSARS